MQRTRKYLYERFQNGQKPDEGDFGDLIDSNLNIQEDNINAGWYYFPFLPHPFYDEIPEGGFRKVTEFQTRISLARAKSDADGSDFAIGIVNIPLPKRINKINNFRVVGFFGKDAFQSNPQHLKISVYQRFNELCKIELPAQRSGPIDANCEFDEPPPINPNEDALQLMVVANTGGPRSFIDIRFFGIEFI